MIQLELRFTEEERAYERWCRIAEGGGLLGLWQLEIWCWSSPSNDNRELPRTAENTAFLKWKARDLVPKSWEEFL